MVTSKYVRRLVPIFLSLILLIGGVCGGLCYGNAGSAVHSCCHGKSHCGHAGPATPSDLAVPAAVMAPALLSAPVVLRMAPAAVADLCVVARVHDVSPSLPPPVLRL